MIKRICSIALSFIVIFASIFCFSFTAHADNSGFGQIRIYYKVKDDNGNWGSEQSAIITDNSCLPIYYNNQTVPVQITRFLIRNDSVDQLSRIYFQFDINFGGQLPSSGSLPSASYSSLSFTSNGGVTAYSFSTTDKSNFAYQTYPFDYPYNDQTIYINSSSSRTFFGRCDQSGYITFNNPVNITFRKNDSPSSYVYIFFRHLVIGLDNSSYLANMESYLSEINDNTQNISDILDKHDNISQDWLDAGGQNAIDQAFGYASPSFGMLGSLLGLGSVFSYNQPGFTYSDKFWTTTTHDFINPNLNTRSFSEYIDFYQINLDEFWKVDD